MMLLGHKSMQVGMLKEKSSKNIAMELNLYPKILWLCKKTLEILQ